MPTEKDLNQFRGDLGENIVAYELMKRGWNVMKNLGGHGYDLLAIRSDGRVQRRIEVKTTDPATKTGKTKDQLTAIISESEADQADFLIYYLHGYDTYFILPKDAFPDSRSVTVFIRDDKIVAGPTYEPYRNKWDGLK